MDIVEKINFLIEAGETSEEEEDIIDDILEKLANAAPGVRITMGGLVQGLQRAGLKNEPRLRQIAVKKAQKMGLKFSG